MNAIQATPRSDPCFPELAPTQEELVEARVRWPAAAAGMRLPVVGVTERPEVQRIIRADDGGWLVASRFDADPAFISRGATYAPEAVIRRLDALIAANVVFDEIYIFDELPPEWMPGQLVPEMRSLAEWRAARTVAAQGAVFAFGATLLAGAIETGRTVGRAVATLGAAAASFDPALIGGVRDPATDRWVWLLIAQWGEVSS